MKIRPKIPMLLGGNNIWYNGILDYDPTRYVHAYDTSRLVNPLNFGEAWASRTNGYGRGRYVPNPNFTRDYVKNVIEANKYYQNFTNALFNTNGTLSDVGKAYARLSDNLLPKNSLARVYNGDLMRSNWTTTNNDTYGRPGRSFNNIKSYLEYERTDNLPGGRHNVFLDKGKRYFYVDNEGKYHWVSPEDAAKYKVSEKPVELGWGDDGVYWEDYEITGPSNKPVLPKVGELGTLSRFPSKDEKIVVPKIFKNGIPVGEVDALEKVDKESFADKLRAGLKNVDVAGLIDGVRLAGNLINNQRVYDIINKSIRPALLSTYRTHRQIVGDEATKLAYYRRAAQGLTRAARPFTSDADRLMAYQFEAKRIGDELRALGDLADNQEIRRTSDESNQHLWDNIRRATDVANLNKIAMLDALAKKAQLLAQKESSDWTNIDLFLLGKLAKILLKQAEEKAWNRQLTELLVQQNLLNDEELLKLDLDRLDAYTAWENAKPEEKEALKSKVTEANKKYLNKLLLLRRDAIQLYKDSIGSYKSGSKLEYKYKDNTDKYLYKTSRDIVEHFRKMSKMTDDSRIRSREKKIKLEPHPRGNTRKYLLGGLAPFTIYRPLGVGGESAVSSQVSNSTSSNSSSDKKSDKEKDKLDLAKKLFESLKGLPVDVNMAYKEIFSVFNKAKMFGEDLSTDDIASLYLSSMLKLNTLLHSQEAFKNATTNVTAKDGLQEYAVAADGRVVVQNLDTAKIEYKKLEDILNSKGKYNPLTNNQLLQLRAHSPELAFDDNILNVVNAGIGINKIGAEIKSLAGTIGSSESKLEGISQIEANKVRAGLQILAGTDGTPDGYYQVTNESKDSKAKVVAALRYIESVLPESYKTILKLHGGPNIEATIAEYLSSGTSDYSKLSIAPLTGKASDKDKTNNGINSNLLDQILRDLIGVDRPFEIITKDGNTKLYSLNSKSISLLPNVNQDMSIDRMLSESKVGTIMDSRLGVTFGDQIISPENFKDIMFDSAHDVLIVTLPCKIINGHKVVNFAIKDEFDNAIKEASKVVPIDYSNPLFIKVLSLKLHEKGLDSLLNGDNIDPNMFGHFMVVSAYTTDRIKFNTNSRYIEKVKNPDSNLEDRIVKGLSTNKDKNDYELDVDDKFGFFELTYDDVYRGNVFIPLNNDPVSAQTGWGGNVNLNEAHSLAEDYQNFQKSSKQKESSSSVLQ